MAFAERALGFPGSKDDKKKDWDNNSGHTGDSRKAGEMSPPGLRPQQPFVILTVGKQP